MKIIAIIVAAGRGSRFGSVIPKQYQEVSGKTLLRYVVETFIFHPEVDDVLVVYNKSDHDLYLNSLKDINILAPIEGGDSRQKSVMLGLKSINSQKPDIVLIHDAARSFVNTATISRVIEKVISTDGGVVPVLPIVDTLKFSKNGFIYNTKSRENLFSAQPPQGFMYSKIYNAHNLLEGMSLPDDASLFEEIGEKVSLVHGSESNFKITTREDLKKAKKLFGITNMETRIGQGFDVHKFEEGDHVTLCGVNISHTQGLKGHSDADVAIHAITDCLLGAISKGDIGEHFPPSDPQWKNAPSSLFLKHVSDLISNQGGVIINIDLTILCEAPKITPHKEKMRKVIAEILNLSISRVSVKATTTERLGFTGREEGIAAMATAAVMINVGNEC